MYLTDSTNELTKAWSGRDVKSYKALKNLKKESLRDNMTDIELTSINLQNSLQRLFLNKKSQKLLQKAKMLLGVVAK